MTDTLTVSRDELRQVLGEAIDERLDSRRTVDEETHRMHHDWIKAEVSRREKAEASITRLRESVVGYLFIVTLAGIGTLAYLGLQMLIRSIAHK